VLSTLPGPAAGFPCSCPAAAAEPASGVSGLGVVFTFDPKKHENDLDGMGVILLPCWDKLNDFSPAAFFLAFVIPQVMFNFTSRVYGLGQQNRSDQ
jgi:hypothetical protein